MKKLLCLSLIIFLLMPMSVNAGVENVTYNVEQEEKYPLMKARATAYCLDGITASGKEVRKGICASKREWLGKTIVVYQRLPGDKVGRMIGIYESLDTGGTEAIKKGWVVDIWQPDLDACQEFMDEVYEDGCGGKIFIQVIDAVG